MEPWQQIFETDDVNPGEGTTTFFYLDTRGLVTIYKGCQLARSEAANLRMFMPSGQLATQAQVLADYDRVSHMAFGQALTAQHFYSPAAPHIMISDGEALVAAKIQAITQACRHIFPQFDTWPDESKIGTAEIPWGTGIGAFHAEYDAFITDAQKTPPDWVGCSQHCLWADPHGWYAVRNANRVKRFKQAAGIPV